MISLYLYPIDKLKEWVSNYVSDETTTKELFECAFGFLVGKESWKNIRGLDYFETGSIDDSYMILLRDLDAALLDKEYEPDWDIYDDSPWSFSFALTKVEEAITLLKQTSDFFYLHTMVIVFFGGITEQYLADRAVVGLDRLLREIYSGYKSYVIAKKLTKDFSNNDVVKAAKNYHMATPINPEHIPPYAIGTTSIIEVEGKYYLTDDIIKAIDASSGVAQALERQDLEGGLENAASEQARPRNVHD